MDYVYALRAKHRGHILTKIGKTTRTPEQRLAEINDSWATRGIRWKIDRVMTVPNCHAQEAAFHRQYKNERYSSKEISQWLGGRCDGDSEIFCLSRSQRRQLYHQMGAYSWSFDWKTWLVLGFGVGLIGVAWMRSFHNFSPPPRPTQNKMIVRP